MEPVDRFAAVFWLALPLVAQPAASVARHTSAMIRISVFGTLLNDKYVKNPIAIIPEKILYYGRGFENCRSTGNLPTHMHLYQTQMV